MCAACATVPPNYVPAPGVPTAEITYVRIANAVPGYFNEQLQISHGGCDSFLTLSAFPRGDRDPARSEPRTLSVQAVAPTCFKLHMDEIYPMHGLADCNSIFEIDLAPGRRYTLRHVYEARPGEGLSIRYRCRPEVTDTATGDAVTVRLVEES